MGSDGPAVLVSGIGVMLPGADSTHDLWAHLVGGRSQVRPLVHPLPEIDVHVGAYIEHFDYRDYLPDLSPAHAKWYSREIMLVLAALDHARRDAGLDATPLDPARVGVLASSSRGPAMWWSRDQTVTGFAEGIPVSDSIFASLAGCPASLGAIRIGAAGLVSTISNACVGGHQVISLAMNAIRSGEADVMYVVGHEFPLVKEVMQIYGSQRLRVLSREKASPVEAVKPYDSNRDGFVLGEGAVVLVLERSDHARRRQANVYARLMGGAAMSEGQHGMRMDITGQGAAETMMRALRHAGCSPGHVDYVCGHGTATRYNDLAEGRAARIVFGEQSRRPPLGSIKPVYGHLLGAAGILNCAAVALMLKYQCLVPTINCVKPDPECAGDHVTEGARRAPLAVAMSMAFAVGSQNSAIVLGAVDHDT
ncbi:beta-ketoacyl-[acyl-carrier-protein] synthase family protein [Nonomuraea sp. NPDC050547]|uniref:beta-ketoacyl-[acyl-carrier-protein] synthase family protein n=1 Tax=unclassified Nonomuraea TaxID=2593643 RepID=UPI0037BC0AE0